MKKGRNVHVRKEVEKCKRLEVIDWREAKTARDVPF